MTDETTVAALQKALQDIEWKAGFAERQINNDSHESKLARESLTDIGRTAHEAIRTLGRCRECGGENLMHTTACSAWPR